MNRLTLFINSTVGKKMIVALTGLGLVGFVVGHLAGNLLIYVGRDAFNAYAHKIHSIPVLPLIELGLMATFLVHIIFTISLYRDNRAARGGQKYAVSGSKNDTMRAFAARQMALTGSIVLVFLLVHLLQFRFEALNPGPVGETEFDKAIRLLSMPTTAILYFLGTLLLGGHMVHGIQSTLRSLGIYHPTYTPLLEKGGVALGVALSLGFASLPVYVNLFL